MKNKQYAIYENGGKQFSGTLKQCLRIVARFTTPQDEWVITDEDAKVVLVKKTALAIKPIKMQTIKELDQMKRKGWKEVTK